MTNYIAVEDVVEALLLCGDNNQASQTAMYNLAHPCSLEAAINAMKRGMGKTSSSPRIPRWIAELGVRTMGRIPGFPLTKGRLEALTSRVTYQTSQIERELGYTFSMDIEDYLFELANWWKQQK